ncbi:MAG: type II toxin-antitoxin system RelB/DinJ family antitoxin [Clostridia bacterium]|nr:type II toxin-antitoxin system RelB/DinJ family antitoxin [Clostridia bacterium]
MADLSYTDRLDPDLLARSEAIYAALGMSLETAINVFLRKSVAVGGFPFDVRLDAPSRETLEAMLEAGRIATDPQVKALDVEDALEKLKK